MHNPERTGYINVTREMYERVTSKYTRAYTHGGFNPAPVPLLPHTKYISFHYVYQGVCNTFFRYNVGMRRIVYAPLLLFLLLFSLIFLI